MRKIENFDTLHTAFELLDDHAELGKSGFTVAYGRTNAAFDLFDTRHLVTVVDPYGHDVDQYTDRVIGRWHADENGLSYYDHEEALPSVVVQTAKEVVAYSVEIVKEHRAAAAKEHT